MAEKTYNVGIYCRLSNDDERDGESVSIENQKLLLQRYVRERGWNEIDIYVDDGYTGTNFGRSVFCRMFCLTDQTLGNLARDWAISSSVGIVLVIWPSWNFS